MEWEAVPDWFYTGTEICNTPHTMLFATILMSLTAMTLSQSPYIDYLTCSWQYAAEGSDAQCESGYIAIGACGSETSSDCNTNAAGVQCCRIKDDDKQAQCSWEGGVDGEQIACPGEKLAHGICGSGSSNGTCRASADYSIQCCESSVEAIKSLNCEWLYGDSGENVSCDVNRVLSGQCGSNMGECNGQAHGVYCCDIVQRDLTTTPAF